MYVILYIVQPLESKSSKPEKKLESYAKQNLYSEQLSCVTCSVLCNRHGKLHMVRMRHFFLKKFRKFINKEM